MKPTQRGTESAKSTAATSKKAKGFTDEEKAAMKERIEGGRGELRAREDRQDVGT
jgi:hypothetical protein